MDIGINRGDDSWDISSMHGIGIGEVLIRNALRTCTGANRRGDEGVVEFGAAFPRMARALEVVEEREGLLDDVAELAHVCDVRAALAWDDRQDPSLA
nr:hypothetical protein [Streptomyces sp. CBMAI 2042]